MEDESDEWMNEEYYPPSLKEHNTSNLEWILNTGYGLGKKVAITGFVISSAPIVLPPLVVISALGFACSVPFGLFYASYACTDKIMSTLLSSPDSPHLMHEFEMYSSDEEKQEFVAFEGDLIVLDENGEFGVDGLKYADEYWPNDVDDYENKSMEIKQKNVEYLEPFDDKSVLLDDRDHGHYRSLEIKEMNKEASEEPIDDEIAFLENLDGSYNGDIETKEVNKEVNKEPIDDTNALSDNLDDGHSTDFIELPVSKGIDAKETNSSVRSNEVLLSEEKLWRQIDALRAIVGYQGKRDSTLIAELKALYIFTGVEPPTSFKDPHDLVGLDEKLRILMSVVGVK